MQTQDVLQKIQCQTVLSAVDSAMNVTAMMTVNATRSAACQAARESASLNQVRNRFSYMMP